MVSLSSISSSDADTRVRVKTCFSPVSPPGSGSSEPATPLSLLEQQVRKDGYNWTGDEITAAVLARYPSLEGPTQGASTRMFVGLAIKDLPITSGYASPRRFPLSRSVVKLIVSPGFARADRVRCRV